MPDDGEKRYFAVETRELRVYPIPSHPILGSVVRRILPAEQLGQWGHEFYVCLVRSLVMIANSTRPDDCLRAGWSGTAGRSASVCWCMTRLNCPRLAIGLIITGQQCGLVHHSDLDLPPPL